MLKNCNIITKKKDFHHHFATALALRMKYGDRMYNLAWLTAAHINDFLLQGILLKMPS